MKLYGLFPTSKRILCCNRELLAGLVCSVKLSYVLCPPGRLPELFYDSGKRVLKLVKANVTVSIFDIVRVAVLIRQGTHRTGRQAIALRCGLMTSLGVEGSGSENGGAGMKGGI